MPWFPCPRPAAGSVLALEASRFVRACFHIRGSRRSSSGRFTGHYFRVRGYGHRGPFIQLGIELETLTFIRILSICTSVRVPLTDILYSSPRVSIRALALEWRLHFAVEFSWGRASDPAVVAPEPLEEFLTPSRVILPNLWKRS